MGAWRLKYETNCHCPCTIAARYAYQKFGLDWVRYSMEASIQRNASFPGVGHILLHHIPSFHHQSAVTPKWQWLCNWSRTEKGNKTRVRHCAIDGYNGARPLNHNSLNTMSSRKQQLFANNIDSLHRSQTRNLKILCLVNDVLILGLSAGIFIYLNGLSIYNHVAMYGSKFLDEAITLWSKLINPNARTGHVWVLGYWTGMRSWCEVTEIIAKKVWCQKNTSQGTQQVATFREHRWCIHSARDRDRQGTRWS